MNKTQREENRWKLEEKGYKRRGGGGILGAGRWKKKLDVKNMLRNWKETKTSV